MFRVGPKVVCVDARPGSRPRIGLPCGLVERAIYTIRDIDHWDGVTGVRLEEIIEPVLDVWIDREPTEPVWRPTRFRPVVDTDIAIFTAMLNPSLEDLRAIVRENANV